MWKFLPAISLAAFLAMPSALAAQDLSVSLGLGAAWQSSPYKSYDADTRPLPLIGIEGERFYLRGPEAGLHLFQNENHAFSLGVAYSGLEFDSGDTDDRRLKQLDDRDWTLRAYLQYALRSDDFGHLSLKVFHDVLNNSDAFTAEASYKYPAYFGQVTLSPGAGLAWDSEEELAYYYGVSAREARKSGLREYSPGGGISPFISLELDWNFTESWSLFAAQRVKFLSSEITDSPMVDDDMIMSTAIGFRYSL